METVDKNTVLFTQLVVMLHTAAMQHMGKLKNPATDTVERNLDAAQTMIDLLDMIRHRTRGNLSDDEAKLVDQMLRELRLNYVDEAGKSGTPPGQGEEKPS
ncbi:MAG: DUF1844 domain-containing protein [Bacteroidota bacterium]